MTIDPAELLRPAQAAEEASRAPLAGTRSQSMQRLQIGLFGLAAMVLLVGLANIIITQAQSNEARVVPEAAPTVNGEPAAEPARDPLADAGVVPDLPSTPEPQQRAAQPSQNGNDSPATR